MCFKLAKIVIGLVVSIIAFECVCPAFAQENDVPPAHLSIYKTPASSSLLSLIFIEKAEEEEKSEEENDKFISTVLADFTRIVLGLSNAHSISITNTPLLLRLISQPSLCKLNCIFLI